MQFSPSEFKQLKEEDKRAYLVRYCQVIGHSKKISMKDLEQYGLTGSASAKEAARALKLEARRITDVCNGRRKEHGGFRWKHAFQKEGLINQQDVDKVSKSQEYNGN